MDDSTQQAFLYGPIVLAGQFSLGQLDFNLQHNQGPEIEEAPRQAVPNLSATGAQLEDWIKLVPDEPLIFRTSGQVQDVMLKPLNQSWGRFAVYWTVRS